MAGKIGYVTPEATPHMTSVLIVKASSEWRAIHAVADRLVPSLRRAFLDAVARASASVTWSEVVAAMERGDFGLLQRIGFSGTLGNELRATLRPVLDRAIVGGGNATVQRMPASVQAVVRFDLTNPRAVEAVDQQVATVVRELVNVNHQAVQSVIRQGFTRGVAPRDMARQMRESIGLTPQYALAVDRYRAGLEEQGVSLGRQQQLAGAYAERLRRLRAVTVARTETIRAANAGQQAAWGTAVQERVLERDVRQVWIVTPDDALCPICEGIEAQYPDGIPLGSMFQTPDGPVQGPPAHPNCRCALGLLYPEES